MNREGKAKLGELNHLSNLGKEIKRDSESSGERNWKSLNPLNGGCRAARAYVQQVIKRMYSGKVLGKPDREGEIPVREIQSSCRCST